MPIRPLLDSAADLAERFVEALAGLMRTVVAIGTEGGHPTLAQDHAVALYLRLTPLFLKLINVCNFGIQVLDPRAPKPKPEPEACPDDPPVPAPAMAARGPSLSLVLPRRKGWLLDALPELAPALADELRTLFEDPAVTALFDQAPILLRGFRPLMRSLGLTIPENVAEPPPPRPGRKPHPAPSPASCPAASPGSCDPRFAPVHPTPTSKNRPLPPVLSHALIVP